MSALRVRMDLKDADDRGDLCVPKTEFLGVVIIKDSCGPITQCDDGTCKFSWWFILIVVLLVVMITALAMCCIFNFKFNKACC